MKTRSILLGTILMAATVSFGAEETPKSPLNGQFTGCSRP